MNYCFLPCKQSLDPVSCGWIIEYLSGEHPASFHPVMLMKLGTKPSKPSSLSCHSARPSCSNAVKVNLHYWDILFPYHCPFPVPKVCYLFSRRWVFLQKWWLGYWEQNRKHLDLFPIGYAKLRSEKVKTGKNMKVSLIYLVPSLEIIENNTLGFRNVAHSLPILSAASCTLLETSSDQTTSESSMDTSVHLQT